MLINDHKLMKTNHLIMQNNVCTCICFISAWFESGPTAHTQCEMLRSFANIFILALKCYSIECFGTVFATFILIGMKEINPRQLKAI